ncbi:hypothetical protein [Krasilnikovia sp. M28-CT-15]|uniref:hypothetical protein n=1 Tax=Krasilnikovia sp. M28-CT-15 TaxID=3373540 RepID=UPI003875BC90
MRKSSILQKGARVALAAGVAAGISTAAVPATPAAAACGSVVYAHYINDGNMAWKLKQNSSCTERWGQIVVDYQPDPTGIPLAIRVVREIKSPYGYAQQAAYTKISGVGAEGTWNTSHTSNSSGENDRHKICWDFADRKNGKWVAPSSWSSCSSWQY